MRTTLRLTPSSGHWPRELDTIDGCPEELWARGRLELLERAPRVGVVGSRSPTPYGEACARAFARGLAAAGVVVVSGLARGVDQAAHRGALEVGGATLAVLGSGVDRPWPTGEATERVATEGLLLSEFRPGQPPRRHHFPLRNRVISGLSRGVLVVEAARASGSLITARWAADQGRDVWAVPGRIDHPMAAGCHRLIREGATLVESPEEILRELGVPAHDPRPPLRDGGVSTGGGRRAPLERELLAALRGETLTADELTGLVRADPARVLTPLVELELAGAVARGPGGLYRNL
jgi:DNA processing protein